MAGIPPVRASLIEGKDAGPPPGGVVAGRGVWG